MAHYYNKPDICLVSYTSKVLALADISSLAPPSLWLAHFAVERINALAAQKLSYQEVFGVRDVALSPTHKGRAGSLRVGPVPTLTPLLAYWSTLAVFQFMISFLNKEALTSLYPGQHKFCGRSHTGPRWQSSHFLPSWPSPAKFMNHHLSRQGTLVSLFSSSFSTLIRYPLW